MKKLTIGITTYNNEPFIDNLLYEINEQIKANRELLNVVDFILYDDKSTENNFYAEIPEYIKFVRSESNNKSPAFGRNYIIDNTKSEYLFFIDGDDMLIRSIESIIEELKFKTEDILFSEVVKIGADGQHISSPFIYTYTLMDEETPLDVREKICVHQTGIWSIYRTDFLKETQIRYETNMRYEDNYFLYSLLLANPEVGILSKPYYGWRINFGSFSYTSGSTIQRVNLYEKTMSLLQENMDSKFAPYIMYSVWNQTYANIIRNYANLNYSDTKKYFMRLNNVSNRYQPEITKLRKNVDKKYVDKYFKIRKFSLTRNFAFIMMLQMYYKIKGKKNKRMRSIGKLACLLPLQKNKIFLTSQYGQYGSNPKYLYLKLKKERPDANIVYLVKDKALIDNNDFFDYNNKFIYYYHLYTAKHVYFDTWMDPALKKRKNQIWTQMWHGYPYKKIFTDIEIYNQVNNKIKHENKKNHISKWDSVYSLDAHNTRVFKKLFPEVTILEKEYERIEWLIKNKDNEPLKESIINKYGLSKEHKYTLYAPTYRPYNVYFDKCQIDSKIKKGNQLIYNAHPMLKTNLSGLGLELQIEDIQEILLITDQLITDYSSIKYDFLKINKESNVSYYKPDEDLYEKIHGLY